MKHKLLLFFTLFLFASTAIFAQDRIYMRTAKKFIKAKITEFGLDEIKYKEFENPDGPIFSIEKDEIEKIEYASGRIEKFEQSISAKVSMAEMHKNNLKFGLWTRYSVNANLLAQASYLNNKKDGNWFVYNEAGVKLFEMIYKDGEKTGIWSQWDENGKLIKSTNYSVL